MKSIRPIRTIILAAIAVIISTLFPYTYSLSETTGTLCLSGNCDFIQRLQVHGWPFWFFAAPHLAGGVVDHSSFPVLAFVADYVFWAVVIFFAEVLLGAVRKRCSNNFSRNKPHSGSS